MHVRGFGSNTTPGRSNQFLSLGLVMFISTLLLLYLTVFLRGTTGSQTALIVGEVSSSIDPDDAWDFDQRPSVNATGHLVFHSVASLLQHWPNTLYRNGHSIVPGTVPPGTLLYRGSVFPEIPPRSEWVATDPEHANNFCLAFNESGCWQLTLMATRPLKVLYFDGTSAGKMEDGALDTQDLVAWGRLRPECNVGAGELFRIRDLCEWGAKYNLDGFVRMEMNFEIMLCDFNKGVEIVSFLNLPYDGPLIFPPIDTPPTDEDGVPLPLPTDCGTPLPPSPLPPPGDPKHFVSDAGKVFRVVESGSWHYHYPGDPRIHLDLNRFVSFYDTDLFPSLMPVRLGKARWEYRLEGISKEDVDNMYKWLEDILSANRTQIGGSGVDWSALVRVVMNRYGKRLEILQYILQSKGEPESGANLIERNWTAIVTKAHEYLGGMLNPHIVLTAVPPSDGGQPTNLSWAVSVFKACATTHTASLKRAFLSKFTRSERLVLKSIEATEKEICRVLVRAWAEGAQLKSHKFDVNQVGLRSLEEVSQKWESEVSGLMEWLGWADWTTCRPACGHEELCYLPGWPFFYENPSLPHPTPTFSPIEEAGLPKPFCIRQMPPYSRNRW